MIEPTESESKAELDRFIQAMLFVRDEIRQIEDGHWPLDDNPLVNAPHTAAEATNDKWDHPYSRNSAVFPSISQFQNKFWPPVGRVDNAYGDRNLVCSCLPLEVYEKEASLTTS